MYKGIKRVLALMLTAVILIGANGNITTAYAETTDGIVDTSEIDSGIIIVNNTNNDVKVNKVRVINDEVIYTYDYKSAMRIPLQSGNGVYQVILYSLVGGNKYKQVAIDEVDYNVDDGVQVYLQSNQMVNWNESMKAVKKASELTKSLKTDSKKVTVIYNYIVNNYTYDQKKADTVKSGYIPSIDDIYTSKKGICYDYSVLFAAMLRSVGIPAKVLMGTSTNVDVYHAWNQVYLNEKWITVDTTLDAGLGNKGQDSMVKQASQYTIAKQY